MKKSLLSVAISAAIGVSVPSTAISDIYEFTFDNGGCVVPDPNVTGDNGSCVDQGDAVFTLLDSTGSVQTNTSKPYYYSTTWGYGKRTQIGGSLILDTVSGKGLGVVNPFEFFNGGSAVAHDITMQSVGDGAGGPGTLIIGNMLFDWNGNNNIPVEIVFDGAGIFNNLSLLDVNAADLTTQVIRGDGTAPTGATAGATPGSNGVAKGKFPIGPAVAATTTWDTDGTTITGDDGVSGSPMTTAPFPDFNANFDIINVALKAYNDTTPPVLTLGAATVNVPLDGTFDPNNPGVTVTCSDNADGTDDITNAAATNPSISFTVVNGDGTAAVDVATEGNYTVSYTCTDSAGSRPAVSNDPANPGNPTIPADNTSAKQFLNVAVGNPNRPIITLLGNANVTHEACTQYTDAGATAVSANSNDITASIVVTDNNNIIGTSPNEQTATIDYDVNDGGDNPGGTPQDALTVTRTVTVTDTLAPTITFSGGTPPVAANAQTVETKDLGSFVLATATATDANNCNSATVPTTSNTVVTTVPSGQDSITTNLTFTSSDTPPISQPNSSQAVLSVTVERSEPVITLNGDPTVIVPTGGTYTEAGMTIHDAQAGDVATVTQSGSDGATGIAYTITGTVDTSTNGTYTITYEATDPDGISSQVTRSVIVGAFAENSNFTMLDSSGQPAGGGANDITFIWNGTPGNNAITDTNFDMQIISVGPTLYAGGKWIAHDVRTFGPGTYTVETDNGACDVATLRATGCPGTGGVTPLTFYVPPGYVGVHMLFDYPVDENGNADNVNIDVVNVWEVDGVWNDPDGNKAAGEPGATVKNDLYLGDTDTPPDVNTTWKLVSTDVTAGPGQSGDGINGAPMVDGPFIGFHANFNAGPGATTAPPPACGPDEGCVAVNTKLDDGIGVFGIGAFNVSALLAGFMTVFGLRRYRK